MSGIVYDKTIYSCTYVQFRKAVPRSDNKFCMAIYMHGASQYNIESVKCYSYP